MFSSVCRIFFFSFKRMYGFLLHFNHSSQFCRRSVRNGDDRSVPRHTPERSQNSFFRFRVEIRRYFIKQQQLRFCRRSPDDGKELPLSLRKQLRRAGGIISLFPGSMASSFRSIPPCSDALFADGSVIQRNLLSLFPSPCETTARHNQTPFFDLPV